MRPQNYVCVLVTSSGIALISSFLFFLELFRKQNHSTSRQLDSLHGVILGYMHCPRTISLYFSSSNFDLFVQKQYGWELIQQIVIHQIGARALCTTLALALQRAQFENLGSQHQTLHGGVTIPAPWHGPPHGEPDFYVVQISCAPFIMVELHYFNMK